MPSTSMYGLRSHDRPNSSRVIDVGSPGWPAGRRPPMEGLPSERSFVRIVFGLFDRTRMMICVTRFFK